MQKCFKNGLQHSDANPRGCFCELLSLVIDVDNVNRAGIIKCFDKNMGYFWLRAIIKLPIGRHFWQTNNWQFVVVEDVQSLIKKSGTFEFICTSS